MRKVRLFGKFLALWARKTLPQMKFKLSGRGYVLIVISSLSVFSASVVVLELLPSHWLVNTTFVATLETQSLTFRTGALNADISGISGSRISLHAKDSASSQTSQGLYDLTRLEKEDSDASSSKVFSKQTESTHLELDSFLIPSGSAVEILTFGTDKYVSLQIIEEDRNAVSEVAIVWNGIITSEPQAAHSAPGAGSERWQASAPLIEIENPHVEGLIYSPVTVHALSTERLRLSGSDQIATSSLLQGEIQFYVGNYPSNSIALRTGEFTQFSGLNAQLANFELTENGIRFILVGKADSVQIGFLKNRREIIPSLLDGIRSIDSLVIILSSLFALLLAGLSALSLGRTH